MRLRPLAWIPFLPALMVFGWEFVLGCVIGREAGWMLYIPAGFLPLAILGFPWFLGLMPEGQIDLTLPALSESWLPWRYHGAAFLSLMLNAFIAAVLIEFACRLFARRKN